MLHQVPPLALAEQAAEIFGQRGEWFVAESGGGVGWLSFILTSTVSKPGVNPLFRERVGAQRLPPVERPASSI